MKGFIRSKKFIIILLILVILVWIISSIFLSFPSISTLLDNIQIPSVQIVDRHGRLLYEIIPDEGRNIPLSSNALPQCIIEATIAVEDKNFYENSGVDLMAILRATWMNWREKEIVSGASTITQQVARNLILDESERFEQSYRRKLREAVLAWQLTNQFSKDEILLLYLNQMYYGGLSYGVEAASMTYFGKSVSELILPECALLAGLPQAPSLYNPYTNVEFVLRRQKDVLLLMEKEGFISAIERIDAENYPISFNSSPFPVHSPHFVWIINNQLDLFYKSGVLDRSESLVVQTTLDLDYQEITEDVIKRSISGYQTEKNELDKNVNNAAAVVLDPNSGDVLALVGSVDYFDASIDGAVNMAISPRQTGSTLKPFIYALALDPTHDYFWTAATPILDVQTDFIIRDGKTYTPSNYDELEHGFVTVREALGSSLNIPAVITLEHVGVENMVDFIKQMGVTSVVDAQNYDLSLALGGGQISLLQMTNAFSTLASGGLFYENNFILSIENANGDVLFSLERNEPKERIDPRVAWLITNILSDDNARKIGFGLNSTLKIDRPAAVKTGTTTNFHDNWSIGYTPDLVVGVWVGNSNHEAMQDVTGLTGAAPIWHETIRTLLQGKPILSFERPAGLVKVDICSLSGLLPTSACQKTRKEWFLEETVPTTFDHVYQEVSVDIMTGFLANETTPLHQLEHIIVFDLHNKEADWARKHSWNLLSDLTEKSHIDSSHTILKITYPNSNTNFRIDPNLSISSQQIQIETVVDSSIHNVSFWVNGEMIDMINKPPYHAWWQLSSGEYRFWLEGKNNMGEKFTSEEILITVIDE